MSELREECYWCLLGRNPEWWAEAKARATLTGLPLPPLTRLATPYMASTLLRVLTPQVPGETALPLFSWLVISWQNHTQVQL